MIIAKLEHTAGGHTWLIGLTAEDVTVPSTLHPPMPADMPRFLIVVRPDSDSLAEWISRELPDAEYRTP